MSKKVSNSSLSLKEEIESLINNLTDRDTLPYVKITDEILELFEKRIDSIDTNPNSYYEWHCENARDSLKEEVKELLK